MTDRPGQVPREHVLNNLLKRVEAWKPAPILSRERDWSLERDVMQATLVPCKEQSFRGFKMYWVGDGVTNALCLTDRVEGVIQLIDERLTGAPIALSRRQNGLWVAAVGRATAEHAYHHMALLAAALKELMAEAV
jgi:hypothetical protein